jgi:3-polyprenyl-4-hydroxybenzoate decarboxylase
MHRGWGRDVDIHNPRQFTWKAFSHIAPERSIQFVLGSLHQLKHASRFRALMDKLPCRAQ